MKPKLKLIENLVLPSSDDHDEAALKLRVAANFLYAAQTLLEISESQRAAWEAKSPLDDDEEMKLVFGVIGVWGEPDAFISSLQGLQLEILEVLELSGIPPSRAVWEFFEDRRAECESLMRPDRDPES